MRVILLILTFCFVIGHKLQRQVTNSAGFQTFIPKGFTLLDSAYGDLNMDAFKDLFLILKSDKEKVNSSADRPILLLAGTPDGFYKLIGRNDSVVLCAGCGGAFGDPYKHISIKNGYFSIEHVGGFSPRWTRVITFKYNAKDGEFKLHRDAGVSYHPANSSKEHRYTINNKKYGKLLFSQYTNSLAQE